MFWYVFIIIVGYLIGSINVSIILSKKITGKDIRTQGSGNPGTTNTLRVMGKKSAAIVLLFDICKGIVVVLLAKMMSGLALDASLFIQLAAIAVIVGHNFPIYYGFKGGKGVATSLGIIIILNPLIGAICLAFAVVIMAITKMVSLGCMLAGLLYPILTIFLDPAYFIFSLIVGGLLIFRHRSNIKRILSGTENKLSFKK